MKLFKNGFLDYKLITPIILLICILPQLPLVRGYFIQDEWQLFSVFYGLRGSFIEVVSSFLIPHPGQYVPITLIASYVIFYFFKLDYIAYFIPGLFLFVIVGWLLFKVSVLLTEDKRSSFMAMIFYFVSPMHFQATSWVVANVGYHLSAAFALLSLLRVLYWLKDAKLKHLLLSSVFLLLSLLSKGISMYFIVLIPLLVLFQAKSWRKAIESLLTVVPAGLLVFWSFWFIKIHPLPSFSVQGSITTPLNLITLPVRAMVQSLFPQEVLLTGARYLSLFLLHTRNISKVESFAETSGMALVVGVSFLVLVGFSVYFVYKDRHILKPLLIVGSFILLSGLPFYFVTSAKFELIPPRYLYFGVTGVSIGVAYLSRYCTEKKKYHWIHGILLILIFLYGVVTVWQSLNLVKNGSTRKFLLTTISQADYRSIKNFIFIDSDVSFYGLPENVRTLPFQNGLGKTLAVYLHDKVHIPDQVYQDPDLLWPIESQGYYQDTGGGFGYFYNYQDMIKVLKKNSLNSDVVTAFSFKHGFLHNSTSKIREQINKDLSE